MVIIVFLRKRRKTQEQAIQQHTRVVVEPHEAAVGSPDRLPGAHYNSTPDVSSPNLDSIACRRCRNGTRAFDYTDNLVPNRSPAIVDLLLENVHALDQECSRIVYDLEQHEPVLE